MIQVVSCQGSGTHLHLSIHGRGRGVTFLPRRTVQAEVEQGTLRAVDLRDDPLERATLLAWTTDRPRAQATQAMMGLMRDTLTP